MNTQINTKRWLDWYVGPGCLFKNLNELLQTLKDMHNMFGVNCGYASGSIKEEIEIVEKLIEKQKKEAR